MNIAILCVRLGLGYAVLAMLIGLHMAMSKDYSLSIAHAHLAIIGWFGLLSTGFLFRNFPAVSERCGKIVAAGLAMGTPLIALGVGLLAYGQNWAEPLATVGSLLVTAAVAWLAYVVSTTKLS